jgi:phosphoribosyl-dephospho-CoA transferase
MFQCEAHSLRTHDLLEVDARQLITAHATIPKWAEEHLHEVPFVVVRRGPRTQHRIPIGVRGYERNQRWASFCSSVILTNVVTPPQLLGHMIPAQRKGAIPALRALRLLKNRWTGLDHDWGPGGSVAFELATGKPIAKAESDLDLVLYAERRVPVDEAKALYARAMDLPAIVDIRMETPVCGFSLREYVRASSAAILLRTSSGATFGSDPWCEELEIFDPGYTGARRQ